jgi:Sugar phosphate isomerases/epimerases
MKICCSTLLFEISQYPNIEDNLSKIKELGFTLVDLAAFEGWQNISPAQLVKDAGYFNKTVQKVKATGLEVGSINSGYSFEIITPEEEDFNVYVREFEKIAELAVSINCPNITVQPGNISSSRSTEESMILLERRAPIIAEIARRKGLTLGVEGHQGSILETVENSLSLMKKLYPLVGFTYDPSHFIMQGIALKDTKQLLDYTVHIHVRNASFGRMQQSSAEGDLNIDEFFGLLERKELGGTCSH